MGKKKPPKAPEILWRLFKKRVNSLAKTIISLILPRPSNSKCRCSGKRCLACIPPHQSMSFLLRPNDSSDYRNLLTHCFVVVPETTTNNLSCDFGSRWKQVQIVRRSIEKKMEQCSSDLICTGYDKSTGNSAIVDLLTSSAWRVLLRRVGDYLMIYLLENTLIFLPLRQRQHSQVSGLSIKNMCFAAMDRLSNNDRNSSVSRLGFEKNKKGTEQQASSSLESSPLLRSSACIGCSQKQYIAHVDGQRCKDFVRAQSEDNASENGSAAENAGNEKHISYINQHSSNETVGSPKKHSRKWCWQRKRDLNSRLLPLGPCGEGVQVVEACSCCSAFQYLPNVNEEANINRRIMLYKMEHCTSVFPRKHIVNSLKPDLKGGSALLNEIFSNCLPSTVSGAMLCSHSHNICQIKSKCIYHSLTKLLRTLIHNARSCQLSRLLDKHCAVQCLEKDPDGSAYITEGSYPEDNHAWKKRKIMLRDKVVVQNQFKGDCNSDVRRSSQPITHDGQYGSANLYSSHKQVTAFAWAVCRCVVPPDLLGEPSNWRKLRMNISRFIRLRRFENFSLKQCMHEIKISKFPLLYDTHCSCDLSAFKGSHSGVCDKVDGTYFVKAKILKFWIRWLFSSFVVPLLQANFYVTESEAGRQELFYYRKSVWEKVISETVESQNFHHLSDESVREIVKNRSFGYSRARLCPKGSKVRVLANLKAPSKIPKSLLPSKVQSSGRGSSAPRLKQIEYQMFKSVNSILHSIHVILKGVQMKLPDKLGSSAFDYNDVYKRLVPFISLLREGRSSIPKIFIVVADVSRAFDSVIQDKLLDVVNTVLLDDEYRLNNCDKILCTKTSLYVQQLLLLAPQDGHSKPGILVNQGLSTIVKKVNIVSDLIEHLKRNILKLGDEFYLQSVGIPQGSTVSSLLCSFYYGHMEKHVIYPYLEKVCDSHGVENSTEDVDICNPNFLLVRLVDDYLFISTSEQQATKFFSRLQRGFCDYNAYMNENKFGSNFHVNHKSEHEANRVFVGQDGISFLKWTGLLINSSTLEIQADYSRYHDLHLTSTLTVNWKGETYRKLRSKLCDYLRPKCHPIFYDANINSASVVRLNIYQLFLLCGMKFHSYVSVLFNIRRLNIKSILGSMMFSLRYMHRLIKRRCYSLSCTTSLKPIFEVEKREIEWLGLSAYIRVLKRKGARYGSLLFLLESNLKSLPINENLSPAMKYATDDVHSSVFWKIKY